MENLKLIFLYVGILEIIIGCYFLLIGFKIINRLKNNPELEARWYSKYQTTFKIGGIVLITMGVLSLPFIKLF